MWKFLSTVHYRVIGKGAWLLSETWMLSSTRYESEMDNWYSWYCLTVSLEIPGIFPRLGKSSLAFTTLTPLQATRRSHRDADSKESHFPPLALLLAISEILANTLSIMSKEYRPDCSAFVQIKHRRKMNLKAHLNIKSFRTSRKLLNFKHSIEVQRMALTIKLEQSGRSLGLNTRNLTTVNKILVRSFQTFSDFSEAFTRIFLPN